MRGAACTRFNSPPCQCVSVAQIVGLLGRLYACRYSAHIVDRPFVVASVGLAQLVVVVCFAVLGDGVCAVARGACRRVSYFGWNSLATAFA